MSANAASRTARLALAATAAMALGACTATVNERGFLRQDTGKFQTVRVGVDTRDSIALNLGSPSNVTPWGEDTWYYISETQEDLLFFRPDTVSRTVLAIRFGADGTVAGVEQKTLADGVEVAIASAETPAKGRELNFWQQLFSSIGRGAPAGTPDNSTGRDRR
jgi:outer membrane protein assembly factor BamE (lipoprotein component of BamABCDE complex)